MITNPCSWIKKKQPDNIKQWLILSEGWEQKAKLEVKMDTGTGSMAL